MTNSNTGPASDKSSELAVQATQEKSNVALAAEHAISPVTTAAIVGREFTKCFVTELPLAESVVALKEKVALIQKGDLSDLEATLVSQATTLHSIFCEMARRSAVNMGAQIDSCERYMRLALKAQSQSRATLETLANIKSPPLVIARQANFSAGHQQVNNGDLIPAAAENVQSAPNKLLDANHGQRLDTRATSPAIDADSNLAPVGKRNRSANGRGKGARVAKRGERAVS